MDFKVGDRVSVTGEVTGRYFYGEIGTIYFVSPDEEGYTVAFDNWTSGHSAALDAWETYVYLQKALPKPGENQSFNIWLTENVKIELIQEATPKNKYFMIEMKIKEMKSRREELGYKF